MNHVLHDACNLKRYHTIAPKNIDRDRTRTCNPQIRSLVPYPLGHTTTDSRLVHLTCVYLLCCKQDCNSALNSAGTETFKLDDEPYLLIFIILTDTLRIADPMAIRVTKFGKTLYVSKQYSSVLYNSFILS